MKYILTLSLLFLMGCTQTGALVANAPSFVSNLKSVSGVPYGARATNTLDIYETNSDNAPVIVFFYGGSWQEGSKDLYRFVGDHFAKRGYVVVIPDYSKFPDVQYPVFLDEGTQAMEWVFANISRHGGDPNKVFIMGHSAGAHTGAMLAADEYYNIQDRIRGFIGLSGPYDFVPQANDIKAIFKDIPNEYMQVTTFIDGTEPPMFLLHGNQDTIVGVVNLQKLSASIEDMHGSVKTKIYDGLDHADTVKSITWIYRDKSTITDDIDAFIKEQVK